MRYYSGHCSPSASVELFFFVEQQNPRQLLVALV
jgi:hypothetical protein